MPVLLIAALACGPSGDDDHKPGPVEAQPLVSAHGLTSEQAASLVLSVGEERVSLEDFATRLGPRPLKRLRLTEPERRRQFFDEMVDTELFAIEARKQGMFEGPRIRQVRERAMVDALMAKHFGPGGDRVKPVTDADVEAYYEANIARFSSPLRVKATHIQLKTRARAQKLLQKVLSADDRELRFAETARLHNTDPATLERMGDLGLFTLEAPKPVEVDVNTSASMRPIPVPDVVRRAAFALERINDIHPEVIESDQGFHLLKLTQRRAAGRMSLAQVQRVVRQQLAKERRSQALDKLAEDLRRGAGIQLHPEHLHLVQVAP